MVAEALSDKAAKETKSAIISVSESTPPGSSATVELIAAVPGKKIIVPNINHVQLLPAFPYGMDWVGAVFKSGSDALTGELHFANAGLAGGTGYESTVNTSYMPDGHFKTASGEALNLTVTDRRSSGGGGTILVYGYIDYYEE